MAQTREAFVNRALLPRLQTAPYEWALSTDGAGRRDGVSDHAALSVGLER